MSSKIIFVTCSKCKVRQSENQFYQYIVRKDYGPDTDESDDTKIYVKLTKLCLTCRKKQRKNPRL